MSFTLDFSFFHATEDGYDYQDPMQQFPFALSIDLSHNQPLNAEAEQTLFQHAAELLPKLLANEAQLKAQVYQELAAIEVEEEGEFISLQEFTESLILEEIYLVDGKDGQLFYRGKDELALLEIAICCQGAEFDFFEIEEEDELP